MHYSFKVCLTAVLLLLTMTTEGVAKQRTGRAPQSTTRYLLFQIFTHGGQSGPSVFPPQSEIESTVKDITTRIANKGDHTRKLGVCLGPLTFNHSDADVRKLIEDGFQIARRNDVAIAFHIDDQMFWDGRRDLATEENIEWTDWKGTPNTGRRLDWSKDPAKIAPQLCLNSKAVRSAVASRARLIGQELRKHITRLRTDGKEILYAGTIAGWESMIGRDYATGKINGYHALVNRGFSATKPPASIDAELGQVVKGHITLWAKELIKGGAPGDKIYSHIAFTPQSFIDPRPGETPGAMMGFATADTAFSTWYQPGFSLYPLGDTLEAIREPLRRHNNPSWIMSEGTNIVPNGMPGEPTMESYLAKLFNHGATIANIFSWGIGGEAERDRNMFRRVTENPEALAAYRKFLNGQPLVEQPFSATAFSPARFREKIERIQKELPDWVHGVPQRAAAAESIMKRLDDYIKSDNFKDADATADEMLRLLGH